MATQQTISEKLDKIEKELQELKRNMADIDSIMTEDDYEALLNYRKDKSAGNLISHKQLKKELGL